MTLSVSSARSARVCLGNLSLHSEYTTFVIKLRLWTKASVTGRPLNSSACEGIAEPHSEQERGPSGFHSCDRAAYCTRVAHRPAAAIDLGHKVSHNAVEFVGCLEIDRMAAIRHKRERCRWNILLHQNARLKARPVLVAGKNQRRNGKTLHLIDQVIERRALTLNAKL